MRVIGCDCGFEASEDDEGGLVERAQDHARRVHGMELPAELILALARGEPRDRVPPRPEENDISVEPGPVAEREAGDGALPPTPWSHRLPVTGPEA